MAKAVPIVTRAVSVDADTHSDVALVQKIDESAIEKNAVRLHPELNRATNYRRKDLDVFPEAVHAGQERLTAVEDNTDLTQTVLQRVLLNAVGDLRKGRKRKECGLPLPGLVWTLVNVTISTVKVAA